MSITPHSLTRIHLLHRFTLIEKEDRQRHSKRLPQPTRHSVTLSSVQSTSEGMTSHARCITVANRGRLCTSRSEGCLMPFKMLCRVSFQRQLPSSRLTQFLVYTSLLLSQVFTVSCFMRAFFLTLFSGQDLRSEASVL